MKQGIFFLGKQSHDMPLKEKATLRGTDMNDEVKYTVRICTDYVVTDPEKTKQILERVSNIISNSYRRKE